MRVSLLPLAHQLRKQLARLPGPLRPVARRLAPCDLPRVATRTWQLAPATRAVTPPAYFLPGQLERITGWAFADEHPGREMRGGLPVTHAPTLAHLVEDAWLIDGVLYKGAAVAHLSPRSTRLPQLHARAELERAALCCSPAGNRWFGQWLMDDCPLHPLAREHGTPLSTMLRPAPHVAEYERMLEIHPARLRSAWLRRLVVFTDVGQNRDKHRRFRAMCDAVRRSVERTAAAPIEEHPGVFLLRGEAGERRVLRGEAALARRLQERRGLRVLDPLRADVATIARTCAGARQVVGVEGSALMHGILALRPGGAVLTLQPPTRFVWVYKHLADRDGQRFGFVVGRPHGVDFTIDADEVERTLDLLERG